MTHGLQLVLLSTAVAIAGTMASPAAAAAAGSCQDAPVAAAAPLGSAASPAVVAVSAARLDPDIRAACTVSIADYLRERAGLAVVDTRDRAERQRLRIPGALALAATEVETRGFLKREAVVLVGSGLDDRSLLERCANLRQAAWNTRVLAGGVRALAQADQPLDAARDALEALDRLTPADLHGFVSAAPARVVVVGVDATTTLPASLSAAERWPANANWPDLARRLRKTADAVPETALAVVTARPEDAQALRGALQAIGGGRIFVLRDGLPAYAVYLDEQRQIAAHAYSVLKRPCGAG